MSALLKFNPSARPLVSLATAALINGSAHATGKVEVVPTPGAEKVEFSFNGKDVSGTDAEISHALATQFDSSLLFDNKDELQKWMNFGTVDLFVTNHGKKIYYINTANTHLTLRSFFTGHSLTIADLAVFFGICHANANVAPDATRFPHLARWFDFVASRAPVTSVLAEANLLITSAEDAKNADAAAKVAAKAAAKEPVKVDENKTDAAPAAAEEGELEAYDGMEHGKVVTRFPPEPSGYLHIGHVKAAMINHYYAKKFNGRMILRFDDTNPSKEKEEFQEAIREDLRLLGIETTEWSYTSDWFPKLQEEMTRWITNGWCYVDDTDWEVMRDERGKMIDSKCRDLPVEENLRRWNEMLLGTEYGQKCCARVKIDMKHKVGCMRDPAMYRCVVDVPHHRTGTTYKAYPLYDFACPLVDSWEGVTHAMRSAEYTDRNQLYEFVINRAGIRQVGICCFSRLNFVNTVLSKRKLTWCIDTGKVGGWDDPRLPTVRGVIRRGLTKEGMLAFIVELGAMSKNLNLMEWDKLWAKNKQIIDPLAGRYNGVNADDAYKVVVTNQAGVESRKRALHPQNPEMGEVDLVITPEVLIEFDDAKDVVVGEEFTLLQWGNVIVDTKDDATRTITARYNPDGNIKKTKKKFHWVSAEEDKKVPVIIRELSHLIKVRKPEDDDDIADIVNEESLFDTNGAAESIVTSLPKGTIIQLNRRGYFRIDNEYEAGKPQILIKIPDGKTKSMSTIENKVSAELLAKGGKTA